MTLAQIVKSKEFTEISETRVDSKKRITLKKVRDGIKRYKVYINEIGQIILDPQVSIPASELWLFKNKTAVTSVRKGLRQSAEGKAVRRRSLAKCADLEID